MTWSAVDKVHTGVEIAGIFCWGIAFRLFVVRLDLLPDISTFCECGLFRTDPDAGFETPAVWVPEVFPKPLLDWLFKAWCTGGRCTFAPGPIWEADGPPAAFNEPQGQCGEQEAESTIYSWTFKLFSNERDTTQSIIGWTILVSAWEN